jgi:diguanylate cyclase (GGDEF)-like protein
VQVPDTLRSLTITDRIYLISRIGMAVVIAAIFATGVLQFPPEQGAYSRVVFTVGIVVLVLGGAVALFARLVLKQETEKVLWEMLPVDLLASGALIWSTGGYSDPFYPWMLGLSISYAAALRERSAWVVSGHAALHQSVDDFLLIVFKAGGLVFTGWVISDAMHRQRDREETLTKSQGDVGVLNEQLSRRLAELHAISEITEVIHSTLDFDRVGPLVLDILSKVIDLPSSCLFVIDKDKDETLFSASAGLTAAAARTYGDKLSFDVDGSLSGGDDTFACTTVLDHKRLMVAFCAPSERLERLSSEDRLVLQAVASELVVAVENSQLYKLTKRLSITDELTGLYNYRFLLQRLDEEIERAKRYNRSLSLLMIDTDDFKRFNDTYGHIAGDQALADVGTALRSAVREIDVVCRYGGEEFAVVLPETDAEGAFVVAEKVREAVAAHSFSDGQGNRGVRVTVSIGLATFPSAAADREELLRQADDALYQAKHLGRDRVRAPRSSVIHVAVEGAVTGDAPVGGA